MFTLFIHCSHDCFWTCVEHAWTHSNAAVLASLPLNAKLKLGVAAHLTTTRQLQLVPRTCRTAEPDLKLIWNWVAPHCDLNGCPCWKPNVWSVSRSRRQATELASQYPTSSHSISCLQPPARGAAYHFTSWDGAHIPCSIVFRWVHGGHFLDFALHNEHTATLTQLALKLQRLEIDGGSCTLRLEVLLLPAESPVSWWRSATWNVPIFLHFGDPQQMESSTESTVWHDGKTPKGCSSSGDLYFLRHITTTRLGGQTVSKKKKSVERRSFASPPPQISCSKSFNMTHAEEETDGVRAAPFQTYSGHTLHDVTVSIFASPLTLHILIVEPGSPIKHTEIGLVWVSYFQVPRHLPTKYTTIYHTYR